MVNVENGKQKAQEQADEKVFLAFGLCRGAHPEEPAFRRHLELAALMT